MRFFRLWEMMCGIKQAIWLRCWELKKQERRHFSEHLLKRECLWIVGLLKSESTEDVSVMVENAHCMKKYSGGKMWKNKQ